MTNFDQVYRKVETILLNEWDPVGIRGVPNAKDEYDSYVAAVSKMIISNRSPTEISNYLLTAQRVQMGLAGNQHRANLIASKLSRLVRQDK